MQVTISLTQQQLVDAVFASLLGVCMARFFGLSDAAAIARGLSRLPSAEESESHLLSAYDMTVDLLPADHPMRDAMLKWRDEVALPGIRGGKPFLSVVKNEDT